MCKHDIAHLMGTADGIVCKKCHKVFPDFETLEADRKGESAPEITPEADPAAETEEAPEITPAEPAEPAPAETSVEEKKAPAKKTASKKAKKEE